jgi:hypothetical protein
MSSPVKYVSVYNQRVELIKSTLQAHTKLNDKAAVELAEHVLDVLNHLPEKVR